MAVKDINAAGGINGHPIKLVTEDSAFDNQTAINALQKVLGSNPSAIVGPVWSNETLALLPPLLKAKVPMLYAGSAGSITQKGNPYIFRDLTNVSYAAPVLAKWFLQEVNAKKPAVMYTNDAFGISLKQGIVDGLAKAGVKPVIVQSVEDSATNASAQVAAVKNSGADAIFGEFVSSQGVLLLNALHQQGLKIPVLLGNPVLAQNVLKLVSPDAIQGVYVESNYDPLSSTDPDVKTWVDKFKKEYNTEPDWAQAINYGAIQVLAHVIAQTGPNPAAVTKGLHNLKDYKGLFGTYTADAEGNLWNTDQVIRFGPNKSRTVVKNLEVTRPAS